ncbi:MAG: efflux RND transporter periplasmic adaptor subunit [Verrucomicrobia bacterium]|nr:efflux RND transporter periplasmic adaptor subunit [Verrucomicrobiota bacterium]
MRVGMFPIAYQPPCSMKILNLFILSTFLPLIILLPACKDSAAPEHGHDPHDEPRMAQITAWSDRYEVFAEHSPPIAGKITRFATHITDLRTGQPRGEGTVRFVRRQGEISIDHIQAAPLQPGIYVPGFVFPQPGDWTLTLSIPSDGADAEVDLGTIKVYPDSATADRSPSPAHTEGVSFTKEQQWRIGVRTEQVAKRGMVQRIKTAGRVRAKPGFATTIIAPVSGQILAAPGRSFPEPGQAVEAGQLLGLLKPGFSEGAARVAEADAEFAIARAAFEAAETSGRRVRALVESGAKSPRELQESELALESAKARYAAAENLLKTFRQTGGKTSGNAPLIMEIHAPIAGVLNQMTAGPGDVVSAQQQMFSILNPSTVWIEAAVPESIATGLKNPQDAFIESASSAGSIIPVTGQGRGRLVYMGLEVDAATRTVPILYETANPESALRVGQHLTMFIGSASEENTLAVPDVAILEEEGHWIVFVQTTGELFAKRIIKPGIRDMGFVQVLEGLQAGDRVVVRGAYAIRLSSISGAIPAHGHTD